MALTIPPLPAIPPQPDATAAWDRWDIYLRCVSLNLEAERINVADRQAAAQAETALAMDRNARASEAATEALKTPPAFPKTTRRAEFIECLRAAAEARIENEPAPLVAAAKSLLASADKDFPA